MKTKIIIKSTKSKESKNQRITCILETSTIGLADSSSLALSQSTVPYFKIHKKSTRPYNHIHLKNINTCLNSVLLIKISK